MQNKSFSKTNISNSSYYIINEENITPNSPSIDKNYDINYNNILTTPQEMISKAKINSNIFKNYINNKIENSKRNSKSKSPITKNKNQIDNNIKQNRNFFS